MPEPRATRTEPPPGEEPGAAAGEEGAAGASGDGAAGEEEAAVDPAAGETLEPEGDPAS